MTSTERVADIRSTYERRGEDVSSMSDTELLVRELDDANREVTKLRRRDEERRATELVRERATYTSARRRFEDRIAAWDRLILDSLSRMSGETVRAALYRAAALSPLSNNVADMADVREAAADALRLWESEKQNMRDSADRHESVNLADSQRREIARLRQLITDHAAAFSTHTRPKGSSRVCECGGCELVRAMDNDLAVGTA